MFGSPRDVASFSRSFITHADEMEAIMCLVYVIM
jgi:hypothetical protein